jgi:hypothetical protein
MRIEISAHIACITIRAILSCALLVGAQAQTKTPSKIVLLNVDIVLDPPANAPSDAKAPAHDKIRIIYDEAAVDARTRIVKPINMQHLVRGQYLPPHPDPVFMPMTDARLDMSSKPYRFHLKASVYHGQPILLDFDETKRRMTVRSTPTNAVMMSGEYTIDPTPVTGDEAIAAATPEKK